MNILLKDGKTVLNYSGISGFCLDGAVIRYRLIGTEDDLVMALFNTKEKAEEEFKRLVFSLKSGKIFHTIKG